MRRALLALLLCGSAWGAVDLSVPVGPRGMAVRWTQPQECADYSIQIRGVEQDACCATAPGVRTTRVFGVPVGQPIEQPTVDACGAPVEELSWATWERGWAWNPVPDEWEQPVMPATYLAHTFVGTQDGFLGAPFNAPHVWETGIGAEGAAVWTAGSGRRLLFFLIVECPINSVESSTDPATDFGYAVTYGGVSGTFLGAAQPADRQILWVWEWSEADLSTLTDGASYNFVTSDSSAIDRGERVVAYSVIAQGEDTGEEPEFSQAYAGSDSVTVTLGTAAGANDLAVGVFHHGGSGTFSTVPGTTMWNVAYGSASLVTAGGYVEGATSSLTAVHPSSLRISGVAVVIRGAAGGGPVTATPGQATETSVSQSANPIKPVVLSAGQAVAASTSFSVLSLTPQQVSVLLADETNASQSVTSSAAASVGAAEDSSTAQPAAPARAASVLGAEESSTGRPVLVDQGGLIAAVGQSEEASSATIITSRFSVVLGSSEEETSAATVRALRDAAVGSTEEQDFSTNVVYSRIVIADLTQEIDTALQATVSGGEAVVIKEDGSFGIDIGIGI